MRIYITACIAILVVSAGCKASPQVAGATDEFIEPCRAQCEARNQMRAVDIASIRAQCSEACAREAALPLVADARELVRYADEAIRACGRLDCADKACSAATLLLVGNLSLALDGPSPKPPLETGTLLIAVGTFTSSASKPVLGSVTTLAPTTQCQ